jgi:hypothetical protein
MTYGWVAVMVVVMLATVCVAPSCDAGESIYQKSNRPYLEYFFFVEDIPLCNRIEIH